MTFISLLMNNHTTKITQVPIKINGNLHFSQIWHSEMFKSLHNVIDVKTYYLR